MDMAIDMIYEDQDIAVCHKMPGVPVQTANTGRQDMVSMLRNYFAGKGQGSDIFLVHRLDQPVEGIMAFARTKKAAAEFSRQLQEKSMDKQYLALVEGVFPEAAGELEDYLLRDGKSNTSKVVSSHQKGAKLARLRYEVERTITGSEELADFWGRVGSGAASMGGIKYGRTYRQGAVGEGKRGELQKDGQGGPLTYVKVYLETGRHHQIRVQMAHAGHPLVGDKKYNPNCTFGYLPIGLCSTRISFCHPITGERMVFTVEPKGALFQ